MSSEYYLLGIYFFYQQRQQIRVRRVQSVRRHHTWYIQELTSAVYGASTRIPGIRGISYECERSTGIAVVCMYVCIRAGTYDMLFLFLERFFLLLRRGIVVHHVSSPAVHIFSGTIFDNQLSAHLSTLPSTPTSLLCRVGQNRLNDNLMRRSAGM